MNRTIRRGEEDMSEKIEWTVEGQMLHRVAKRMEQEEERERIRGMRKLDCGCSVSNVELYYHDDREKSICEGCLQDRIAIGDDPDMEWYEIEEGDIEGYGELWTWQAGQQIPDWTPDHDILAWANQEEGAEMENCQHINHCNYVCDACGQPVNTIRHWWLWFRINHFGVSRFNQKRETFNVR